MSASHGNTPAAWTGVTVAMVGFLVGCVGLLFDPIKMPVFWAGVVITVLGLVAFLVMDRMGLHEDH